MRKFYLTGSSLFHSFILTLFFAVATALSVTAASFTGVPAVEEEETCNNVTNGGSIGFNQAGCAPFDPNAITNAAWPTGGSGSIEYKWMYRNTSTGFEWQVISSANAASYDPGPLNETTMFRRYARRQYCSSWAGESNTVTITVNQCCSNVTDGGTVGYDQSGCAPYDPAPLTNITSPTGGSGTLEYMWKYKNASTNWQFQAIPGALSSSYDPTVISETTIFRRYSKRAGCSTWDGESCDVTITINGECVPDEICTLTGYESTNGRIFWIPDYGTDYRSSPSDPLVLKQYSNGAAHIVGSIEHISYPNKRFTVSLYFENKSTYNEWISQGLQPHSPNLGDEMSWIYYNWATLTVNTLIGQGSLSGTILYLVNQNPAYGLQLGDGANALNTNPDGISNWFSYTGSSSGHGDLNGTFECTPPCAELCPSDETAPEFDNFPEDVTVECQNEIVAYEVTATDDCDTDVTVTYTESYISIGSDTVVCTITDADTHTLWVSNTVKNALGVSSNYFISVGTGTIEKYSDGTLKIYGTVKSVSHSNKRFNYVAHYRNKRNYTEWSSIPNSSSPTGFREAKLDAGTTVIVGNEYLNWDYYEMDTSKPNELVGISGLNGVNLQLQHAPANYQYGAQLGEKGSLQSHGYGFSTWITILGNAFGNYICDAGDFNFDVNDCEGEGNGEFECDDHYKIVRTYTATDNCGNETTQQHIITVLGDTEAPVFDNLPEDQTVLCGDLPTAEELGVTATDNCDNDVIVTVTHSDEGENCEITRIFTFVAEDDCGNQITAIRVFYTHDNIPPVFLDLPESAEVECGELPNPQNYVIHATDNCDGNPEVTFTFNDEGTGCNQTRTITWTAVDDCENTVVATRVFTVVDNEGPVFVNIPENIQMECGEEVENVEVFATDNCDQDVFVDHDSHIEQQECGYLYIRTWTAEDDCGNITTATQTITFVDTTAPVVEYAPQSMTLECSAIIPFEEPVFSDICDDELEVEFTQNQVPYNCKYKIIRRWTATDDCGNEKEVVQTIIIVDTTAPVLVNVPSDVNVNCENIPSVPTNVYAEDVCDGVLDVVFEEDTQDMECGYRIVRKWSAVDACGNDVERVQVITVTDDVAPVLHNVPADDAATCATIPDPTDVTATDNCSELEEIVFEETISDGPSGDGCAYTIIRRWTVEDACGNEATASQSIIVMDNTAPEFVSVPANTSVECSQIPPAPVVLATDECSPEPLVAELHETMNPVNACTYQLIRTWTVTDICGNQNQAVQIINVTDSSAPVFDNAPANVTVSCGEVPEVPNVTASDACDASVDVAFFEMPIGQGCSYVINRVWVATDDCGNTQVHTQVITVADADEPYIVSSPSAEVTISCDEDEPTDAPVFADACDAEVSVSMISGFNNVTDCGYDIEKVWTATDDCGNSVSFTRIIHVLDHEAPVFGSVPGDITVSCDNIPAPAQLTATDNCSEVEIDFEETYTGTCPVIITRTWTATDVCGNSTVKTQVLTVIDNVPPVFDTQLENITAECDNVPDPVEVTATDSCSEVEIDFEETYAGTCPVVITRTWTATDACGNTATMTQVVTVSDTTAPYFSGVPANITVSCNAIPDPGEVQAFDNCDENVEIDFSQQSTSGFCTYYIFRTWVATDDCGNTATVTQMVTVVDDIAPVLHGVPADVLVSCNDIPEVPEVTATDDCSAEILVSFDEVTVELECGYKIIRTWSANDQCGHTTVATQEILVTDIVAPVASNVPAETTIECNTALPSDGPVFSDECSLFNVTLSVDSTEVGCEIHVLKTWTALDECGNSTSVSQLIRIKDTTAPELTWTPAENIEANCDNVPAAAVLTATDNCSEAVVTYDEETVASGVCGYILVRTWVAKDACGNETVFTQYVHVSDVTAPTLIGVPASVTVECNEIPNPAVVTASDNCDMNLPPVHMEEEILPLGQCSYIIVRTWTVNDNCLNYASGTQMITVVDTTAPVLEGVPANVPQVSCDNVPAPAEVTATDNCDQEVEVIFHETSVGSCPEIITRTWTAEDGCGNEVVATQTIHVYDLQAPQLFGVPASTTVECMDEVAMPEVYATDNCTEELEIDFTSSTQELECGEIITRTWTVVDSCGNETSASQIITVVDTTAPSIVSSPEEVLTYECSDEIAFEAPVFTDICDASPEVSFDEETVNITPCGYTIIRTWVATDHCDNATAFVQTIYVVDTTRPVLLDVPANVTVYCNNIPLAAEVEATDNCSGVEVTMEEEIGTGCPYTITRRWTATDECGNSTSQSQVITVIDDIYPVLIGVPSDIVVECDQPVAIPEVTATDNCTAELTVNYEETEEAAECGYIIVRHWSVSDACGNLTTATQNVHVVDTTVPVLSGEDEEITLECNMQPSVVAPTASDNCDTEVDVDFEITTIEGGCANEYTEVYTWTATDDCGNTAVRTLTFHFIDTTPPVLTGEDEELTLECNMQPAVVAPTATDNCDQDVNIDFDLETIEGECANSYTQIYTWLATDNCGNTAVRTLTFHFVDTTAPELSGEDEELTLECNMQPSVVAPTATDNCDQDVNIDFDLETIDGECANEYTWIYRWTATDDCGNTAVRTLTFHFVDTTAPEFSETPENITVECDEVPVAVELTATDNCDANVEVTMEETATEGCSYVITRVYTATDDCGNVATFTHVIHVSDTTAPVLHNVPADITLNCNENIPAAFVTATDNCDSDVPVTGASSTSVFECGYQITRTWTATDDCGNEATASQIITFIDNEAPYIVSSPDNLEVECSDDIPLVTPVFGDNCDEELEVSYETNETDITECGYTIVRTWTAEDDCGNEVSVSQEIYVTDNTAPVIIGEIDVIGYCDQSHTALVTVTDNCDEDVDLVWEDLEVSGGCEGRIIRTYTATDNCGNQTTFVQIITITDSQAPVALNEPQDVTIECTDDIPSVDVEFTDNCDEELEVVYNEDIEETECGYTMTRTWTATDNCGNTAVVDQVVTVADITDPVLHNIPAGISLECGSEIPAVSDDVYATDNCSGDLEVYVQDIVDDVQCGMIITRIFRAFDACGNSTIATQTITIVDTQAPVINGQVEDMTVNCENVPEAPVFTAFDTCDGEIEVVFEETTGEGCPYSIVRTWTATDACGNSSSLTQIISVMDEVNPVFDAFPVWISVSCDEIESYTLTATDNCDSDVEVTVIEELVFSGGCYGNLQRTYKAEDNCGNFVTATQIIQIVDNVDPVIENVPADVTIYCESEIPAVAADVFATDNCTAEVEIFYTETQTSEFCPYDIIRTWTAVDYCGNETVATQVIHVTVEVEQQIVVTAYPNPARDNFTFEFSSPADVEVVGGVYDVTGREVISLMRGNADGGRLYKFTVDARNLNTGTYTIRMIVDGEVYHQRMMITGR